MKLKRTKNLLLGIIAINLTLISCFQLGLLGTNAYANDNNSLSNINYGLVPLNDDGSINIKLSEEDINILKPQDVQNVNIKYLNGWSPATYYEYTRNGKKYNSIGVTILD